MGTQQFYLKWNNHQSNMITVLDQLLSNEAFVDVTLACEGLSLKAHKIILSACSPFFRNLFLENPCKHPIVIMKDVKYTELKAVVDFIYKGEVSISHDQLSGLLKTAEILNIKGLVEVADESINNGSERLKNNSMKQPLINVSQSILPSSIEKSHHSMTLSKKKRSKVKRRSSCDSNSSDNEEISSKLKEPDSPETIEEILPESTNNSHKQLAMSTQAEYHSCQVHDDDSQSAHTTIQPTVSQQNAYMSAEEPSLDYERNYVESSNLLEQIMVTEDKPIYPESTSQDQIESSATPSAIPSTSGLADNHSVHTGPASNESEILASCSTPSEASTSNCPSEDVPDIKPILSFDEPPGSPKANISHKDSNIFIDSSGVSPLPGPSNFQLERQTSESADQQNILSEGMELLGKRFMCGICKKTFTQGGSLKRHLRTHTGEKPFSCDICKQRFSQKTSLKKHFRIHTGEKPFSCDICELKFGQKISLKNHLRTHTGERPFQCEICKESFALKQTLNSHLRIHTGEKPFSCNICKKRFAYRNNLNYHLGTHTNKNPFL